MQVMPILIADSMDGCKEEAVEQRTKEVRAFRKYAMFYKALVGVAKHTEQTLRDVRTVAYAMMDAIRDAFPDQKSSWNFPKVHQIVHLIDAIPLRGMPWEYSTELWEHTHKGTVKVPVRGSNWKDIPRRIVEEEVQREITREVAALAGGGRQYVTALRVAVRLQGHVLTRRSRCANVANEEDPILWVYREALWSDMDGLGRCLIEAGMNTPDIKVHTALAIPRTRGGELVAKGTFVKASPSENWFSDVAVKADEKKWKVKEWYARCLCVFRAKNAEREEGAYVYVKYYEAAGLCPLTTCVQLAPGRQDNKYAVVDVECIKRVHPSEILQRGDGMKRGGVAECSAVTVGTGIGEMKLVDLTRGLDRYLRIHHLHTRLLVAKVFLKRHLTSSASCQKGKLQGLVHRPFVPAPQEHVPTVGSTPTFPTSAPLPPPLLTGLNFSSPFSPFLPLSISNVRLAPPIAASMLPSLAVSNHIVEEARAASRQLDRFPAAYHFPSLCPSTSKPVWTFTYAFTPAHSPRFAKPLIYLRFLLEGTTTGTAAPGMATGATSFQALFTRSPCTHHGLSWPFVAFTAVCTTTTCTCAWQATATRPYLVPTSALPAHTPILLLLPSLPILSAPTLPPALDPSTRS
ncbi:unnamed protein product [Closterium sp. Yama58-4]|nr:unnamed protein product [Closterium sp. Yama58-4]